MAEKIESNPRSWKGFKLSKNLVSAIKNALYILVPAIATELATNNIITAGLAGTIGSASCKAIEFWWKE